MLFSVMTSKALRLNPDLTVDAIGEHNDKYGEAPYSLILIICQVFNV